VKDPAKPTPAFGNTQQITIQLPNRIIERVEKYGKENGNTITGVVIEALDSFLRGPDVY
jgi:hypothetical protein